MADASCKIAFQGVPGAYSHMACQLVKPDMDAVACASFEDMLTQVQEGHATLAMVPVENSTAGRVADIHHLLPQIGPAYYRRAFSARESPSFSTAWQPHREFENCA